MMEYLQVFWADAPQGEPAVIFYEVDTADDRLGRRSIDVFADGRMVRYEDMYDGAIEITPLPTAAELNSNIWGEEFHAREITAAQFESVWSAQHYEGPFQAH